MDVEKFGWLKASEYRQNILMTLEERPRTPKEISEITDYYLSHVSNVLSDLEDQNLVKCVTPERRKGRLWDTTPEGEELIQELKR